MTRHTQTEEFNADSLDNLPEQGDEYTRTPSDGEEDFVYNPELADYDDEGDEGDEEEPKQSLLDRLTGKVNLSKKAVIWTIIVITLAVVVLIVFKPFDSLLDKSTGNTQETSEESGGVMSKIKGIFGSSEDDELAESVVEIPQEVYDFVMEHEVTYPGYTYTYNEVDGSILFSGFQGEEWHDIMYDINFNKVYEYLGDVEVFNSGTTEEGSTEEPVAEEPGSLTEAEVKDNPDLIAISKKSYDNTPLSLTKQNVKATYDDYGALSETKYNVKVIVQYTKVPLNGRVPMINATIIEKGEKIIFPVSLSTYVTLPETGTSVIQITVTEGHGGVGYSDIFFVDWNN